MPRRSGWAYTDGACSFNGHYYKARAGVGVFWGSNHPNNVSARLLGDRTSTAAEVTAATIALRQAAEDGYSSMTIYTDSQVLIDCVNMHIPRWERNGWRKSNGRPVANEDDFKRLIRVMDRIPRVTFRKVEAHSGNFGNEEADRFARAGCKECSFSEYDYDSEVEDDDDDDSTYDSDLEEDDEDASSSNSDSEDYDYNNNSDTEDEDDYYNNYYY